MITSGPTECNHPSTGNGIPPWARAEAREDQLGLLGSILADFSHIRESQDIVTASDFVCDDLARIYRAYERCEANGCQPDRTAIEGAMRELNLWPDDELDQDRLRDTIRSLPDYAITAANIPYYSRRVAAMGRLRRRACEIEDLHARLQRGYLTADEADERLAELATGTMMQNGDQYAVRPVPIGELGQRVRKPEWLVARVLVAGQPCVVGGESKGMKTSAAGIDLGLSLALGRPWLGHFAVAQRRRVLLISGESGDWTIDEIAQRVVRAKCADGEDPDRLLNECGLYVDFVVPELSRAEHVAALQKGIEQHRPDVLILDPAYLALLTTGNADTAKNMFGMGPLLARLARICLNAGCTPIIMHHFTQTRKVGDRFEAPGLAELAYAGFQQFARQWLLFGRREAYEPDVFRPVESPKPGASQDRTASGVRARQSGAVQGRKAQWQDHEAIRWIPHL